MLLLVSLIALILIYFLNESLLDLFYKDRRFLYQGMRLENSQNILFWIIMSLVILFFLITYREIGIFIKKI